MVIDINFNTYQVSPFNSEDRKSTATVSQDGTALTILGNGWKSIDVDYDITPDTILEFDFKSTAQGEIHGIALENDNIQTADRSFRLYGTQAWGRNNFNNYSTTAGEFKRYEIPVGQFYTGESSKILFINDHDISNPFGQSIFANVRLREAGDPNVPENIPPEAVNDKGTTLINKPLTFKISSLLANDTDDDGDTLTLTAVQPVQGGTVTLDGNGNVIFTPNAGFQGEASFNYTVSDGKGGTDIGTVSVNVKTASIGTNLSGISYYSSQVPFLNLFHSSSNWLTQKSGTWDTREQSLLNLDENGWLKSLQGTGTSQQFNSVATLINRDIGGNYTGGQYVVLYEGEGTINYGFDAKKDVAASTPGRDVINVTPSNSGIFVSITATDPNNTGNYLRNIRMVPIGEELTYSENIFNPKFLEKIEPFSTVRLMDWMAANSSLDEEWSDRPTLEDARWTSGVPVEVLVELANRNDVNPWFNLPHRASDDYVTQFAQYVKDNLEPGLKIYVEYGNEIWSPATAGNRYVDNLYPTLNAIEGYAKRATEIANIWDNVFGADKERVEGVLSLQYVNTFTARQALEYAGDSIDAIGVNVYLGRDIGRQVNAGSLFSWLNEPDGGYNKLFQELTEGGVLAQTSLNQRLPALSPVASEWRQLSEEYNLPLFAYEGGQSLLGTGGIENIQPITNLFVNANRDPRMGELYNELLTQWYQVLGGDLFMQFSDIGIPTRSGSWGALEHLQQSGSPKYNAVVDFIENYSG